MRLNLTIDHLHLDGFDLTLYERRQLQQSIQHHLQQRFAQADAATFTAQARPQVDAGEFEHDSSGNITQLGQQIADSVYRSVTS